MDTVKQAEMFASVRAAFDIPRDQAMKLRDFPTLAHVIRFALGKRTAARLRCRGSAGRGRPPSKPSRPRSEFPGACPFR